MFDDQVDDQVERIVGVLEEVPPKNRDAILSQVKACIDKKELKPSKETSFGTGFNGIGWFPGDSCD